MTHFTSGTIRLCPNMDIEANNLWAWLMILSGKKANRWSWNINMTSIL